MISKVLAIIILLVSMSFNAQRNMSYNKGSIFFGIGIPKAIYGANSPKITTDLGGFDIQSVKGKDDYFNLRENMSQFQYHAHLGLFVANHWGVQVGLTHLNYAYKPNQTVGITGDIINSKAPLDPVFNLQQKLTQIQIGVVRAGRIAAFDRRKKYTLTSQIGLNGGLLIGSNRTSYFGAINYGQTALNGFSGELQLGMKFEFDGRVFVGFSGHGGYLQMNKVDLNFDNARLKTGMIYGVLSANIGFYLYAKFKDDCNSCPQW